MKPTGAERFPGFGPADATVLIVGLAPAAHGANRTGRMFTGDRSGEVLFAALHRTGFASQPTSTHAGDGLRLSDIRITAPVHCAPPDNTPTPQERARCGPFLARELELLAPTVRVAVVLGAFGWQALLRTLQDAGWSVPRPRPPSRTVVRSRWRIPTAGRCTSSPAITSPAKHLHRRLTPSMLDVVLLLARDLAGLPAPSTV